VDTNIIQGSTSSVNLDVTKELEDKGFDVSANRNDDDDNDNNDTCSTKGQKSSAVSDKNLAFNSNISELRDGKPKYTQSPQLGLAAASLN
jgi:hypothetical protein